jgi:hypothetical protein
MSENIEEMPNVSVRLHGQHSSITATRRLSCVPMPSALSLSCTKSATPNHGLSDRRRTEIPEPKDPLPRGQNNKPSQNPEVTAELFRFSYATHKIPISRASLNATCPILTDRSMLERAVSFPTRAYCC